MLLAIVKHSLKRQGERIKGDKKLGKWWAKVQADKTRRIEWCKRNKGALLGVKRGDKIEFDNFEYSQTHEKKRVREEKDVVQYRNFKDWSKDELLTLLLQGVKKDVDLDK